MPSDVSSCDQNEGRDRPGCPTTETGTNSRSVWTTASPAFHSTESQLKGNVYICTVSVFLFSAKELLSFCCHLHHGSKIRFPTEIIAHFCDQTSWGPWFQDWLAGTCSVWQKYFVHCTCFLRGGQCKLQAIKRTGLSAKNDCTYLWDSSLHSSTHICVIWPRCHFAEQ